MSIFWVVVVNFDKRTAVTQTAFASSWQDAIQMHTDYPLVVRQRESGEIVAKHRVDSDSDGEVYFRVRESQTPIKSDEDVAFHTWRSTNFDGCTGVILWFNAE